MFQPSVVILLASYNGEKYIKEQINSIREQSFNGWQLFIRDDGSTDKTIYLIQEVIKQDPRITLIEDENNNVGVIRNFELLMEAALETTSSEYVFFADQDDIWEEKKLQLMLDKMYELEKKFGKKEPLLLHSDLEVIDEQTNTINSSFMRYQAIRHEREDAWKVLAVQNFVTGCAMLINRPLLKKSLPIPDNIIMHDWWIALCASVVGHIEYIDVSLIGYRQHDSNEVGAKGFWFLLSPFHSNPIERWKNGSKHFTLAVGQVKKLLDKHGKEIENKSGDRTSRALIDYSHLLELSLLQRVAVIRKYNFRRQHKVRNFLLYCRIILTNIGNGRS